MERRAEILTSIPGISDITATGGNPADGAPGQPPPTEEVRALFVLVARTRTPGLRPLLRARGPVTRRSLPPHHLPRAEDDHTCGTGEGGCPEDGVPVEVPDLSRHIGEGWEPGCSPSRHPYLPGHAGFCAPHCPATRALIMASRSQRSSPDRMRRGSRPLEVLVEQRYGEHCITVGRAVDHPLADQLRAGGCNPLNGMAPAECG